MAHHEYPKLITFGGKRVRVLSAEEEAAVVAAEAPEAEAADAPRRGRKPKGDPAPEAEAAE